MTPVPVPATVYHARMSDDVTSGLNATHARIPEEIYASLRRLAQSRLHAAQSHATLSATALVNEAWLKISQSDGHFDSRRHFMATMAKVMRHVLIDYARERGALRHGGGQQQVTFEGLDASPQEMVDVTDLIAIDEALQRLADFDARLEQVFELRFYAGMTHEEVAETVGVSVPTVKRDLRAARAFIAASLPRADG
jgi:RNA polymerase sigma factor (TIGR02999 family)